MFRDPDWNRTRAVVTMHLGPEERLVTLFTAVIPPPESGGVVVDGALVPLVWAAWHAMWRHATRAASRAADIPVAPRMIVALTTSRIVIWRATRNWRLGKISGEMPRDRLLGVGATAGGPRFRRLVLHLSTGSTLTVLVTPATADQLTALLSVRP
jgi:hypothetical protein